jgi:hypothetical protein
MKTKETISNSKPTLEDKVLAKSKPKSLRPMRSMIAVRSLKPRTTVAQIANPKSLSENSLP